MWQGAKRRAQKAELPFSITLSDVVIPDLCPVFGVPLQVATGAPCGAANSPSIDRLIPDIGYVPGNVRVISWRASDLKRDATMDEIKKLLAWMEHEGRV